MQHRKLGANGPNVSAIGLGCMSFAGAFGETDEATSHRCLDAAMDHGINFLDTANIYGMGRSENVLGTWLAMGNGMLSSPQRLEFSVILTAPSTTILPIFGPN